MKPSCSFCSGKLEQELNLFKMLLGDLDTIFGTTSVCVIGVCIAASQE